MALLYDALLHGACPLGFLVRYNDLSRVVLARKNLGLDLGGRAGP